MVVVEPGVDRPAQGGDGGGPRRPRRRRHAAQAQQCRRDHNIGGIDPGELLGDRDGLSGRVARLGAWPDRACTRASVSQARATALPPSEVLGIAIGQSLSASGGRGQGATAPDPPGRPLQQIGELDEPTGDFEPRAGLSGCLSARLCRAWTSAPLGRDLLGRGRRAGGHEQLLSKLLDFREVAGLIGQVNSAGEAAPWNRLEGFDELRRKRLGSLRDDPREVPPGRAKDRTRSSASRSRAGQLSSPGHAHAIAIASRSNPRGVFDPPLSQCHPAQPSFRDGQPVPDVDRLGVLVGEPAESFVGFAETRRRLMIPSQSRSGRMPRLTRHFARSSRGGAISGSAPRASRRWPAPRPSATSAFGMMTRLLVHETEIGIGQGQPACGLDVVGRGMADPLQRGDGLLQGALRGRVLTPAELSHAVHVVAASEQPEVFQVFGSSATNDSINTH